MWKVLTIAMTILAAAGSRVQAQTDLTAYADAVLRGPAGEWLPALERSL